MLSRVLVVAAVALALAAPGAQASVSGPRAAIVNIKVVLGLQNIGGAATGIVISPNGLVLTNHHVVKGATTIVATDVGNGHSYNATVLGYSIDADVALIQLSGAHGLATASIGGDPQLNQAVTAYGNAGGRGGVPKGSNGKVVGTGISITAQADDGSSERLHGLMETSAAIEPGDSGGPLVDAQGNVIGMDTAGGSGFLLDRPNAGFAIPIGDALAVATQIRTHQASATVHVGATSHLGISYPRHDWQGTKVAGVVVTLVELGSPAEQAGLAAGYEITRLNGTRVKSPNDLLQVLIGLKPGQRVVIGFLDFNGRAEHATVQLSTGPPL